MAEIELAEVGHSFTAEEVECETNLLLVARIAAASGGDDPEAARGVAGLDKRLNVLTSPSKCGPLLRRVLQGA